jgi:hypothetical protein
MPWDRRALTGSKVPKIDWIGGFLVVSGLSLFMFSLTQSGVVEKGWSEPCKSPPPSCTSPPSSSRLEEYKELMSRRTGRIRPLPMSLGRFHALGTTSRE